ncbi:MAG: OB-fold domain-containing protein [Myxococcota bacterium]|nr:OB-fold domain-containing protein [Myxococcota bacterium]
MTNKECIKPAIEGWFTLDEQNPKLLGSKCESCGTFYFPKQLFRCKVPTCRSPELIEEQLSSRGTLWSYSSSHYPPPPPFIASDPFVPVGIAAVELDQEKIIIMGQVASAFPLSNLKVGQSMHLVIEPLYEQDGENFWVWRWAPSDALNEARPEGWEAST